MGKADTKSAHRSNRTICLPFSQQDYNANVNDPVNFRKYIDDRIKLFPEKGSFTGADRQKLGSLELANNGTFFIDEVGDISKSIQLKIFRAVEEKSFFQVGGTLNIKSDFRLLAAINRDLSKEIKLGNFREDLFFRLNVVALTVPPLRRGILILLVLYPKSGIIYLTST